MAPKYKDKLCPICGKFYTPTSGGQKVCAECKPKADKIRNRKYQQEHRDETKLRVKKYTDKHREELNAKARESRKQDPDRFRNYEKRYRDKNKDKVRDRCKKYKEEHKDELRASQKKYRVAHREEINRKARERKKLPEVKARRNSINRDRSKNDPNFKMSKWIRSQVHRCIVDKAGKHTMDILGYTVDDLKKHIESLWEPWMSWSNYGNEEGKWNIDHIKPIAAFHFINEDGSINWDEVKEANSLKNLRPMRAIENIYKSDKWFLEDQ